MAITYRIYSLTPDERILGIPEVIEYDSDREVNAKAKLDGLDPDVWDGPRIVIRLKSTGHG